MRVRLRDGSETRYFQFIEPSRGKWSKQNCEFLKGVETGLPEPFKKVFIKRVSGAPVSGHNLLTKLVGKILPASPRVFGTCHNGGRYLYFFQDLPASFKTLDEELRNSHIISPDVVRAVVRKAPQILKVINTCGFVYIDFCAKNIMRDRENGSIAIIDIDSCWPERQWKTKSQNMEAQQEFWGLWNDIVSMRRPARIESAQQSVLLSFAAVWSRAIALKSHGTKGGMLSALTLVHNPGYDRQRPLWEALDTQNKRGFLEYFVLSGTEVSSVYLQWQELFDALRRGREVSWQEIISATENVLIAIGLAGKPSSKPRAKRLRAPAKRLSKKDMLSQWGMIAQAEAEDIKRVISGRW